MNPQSIANLIIEYRYWILIPLAIVEGPIVAFVSGTLASLGYFNLYALAAFLFACDMGKDAAYYYSGYFGAKTRFVKNVLEKLNIKEGALDKVRRQWEEHPGKTMAIGKLSYGIAQAFIVAAGVVKMSLRKFFSYGALVAVAQYGTLLLAGYFFGNAFGGKISVVIENIQYVIAGATLIIAAYYIVSWRIGRRWQ